MASEETDLVGEMADTTSKDWSCATTSRGRSVVRIDSPVIERKDPKTI